MHSYSFDMNMQKRQTSSKALVKLNEIQWVSISLLSVTVSQLFFSLFFYFLPAILSLAIIAYCINLLYNLNKQGGNDSQHAVTTILTHKSWLIYLMGTSIFDIIVTFIFGSYLLTGLSSQDKFELYFNSLNLVFLLFRPLHLLLMRYYIKEYLAYVDATSEQSSSQFIS